MNARQAKRISLAINGSYLLFSDHIGGELSSSLTFADVARLQKAQGELGAELLRRAGFEEPMQPDEIVRVVLADLN